ncbi:hypothetical protein DZF91_08585 [Actinomadura logoneensis]|uniref:HEAT repeat domain-containing protein n=1 Tax=Actinomadura logoneensis TaxID=2293572 RepID=A0A372JPU1_9ACTN|nr:HEAT repeat domain-containing protein [Actinomadura logoneensis]RFU42055.1 hypothetical protein DZF91_08585 [Actinomadura logoneensis]
MSLTPITPVPIPPTPIGSVSDSATAASASTALAAEVRALDEPTLADLDPYLSDTDPEVRGAAVLVLSELLRSGEGPRGAADTLAWMLADPDDRVRGTAADALDALPDTAIGAEGVEALLLAAASERDERVRRTATALLDTLVRAATELYAQALQEDEPHVRVQAVLALVTLRAADEVAEAADDPAREVRVAVAEGLARLAEESAPTEPPPPDATASAADCADGADGVASVPVLRDPAPYALDHLLADHDPVVRMAAIDAVAGLGAPEPLVGRIVTATAHTSWQVRRRAAMALAYAAPDVAVRPLIRALRDGIVDVRRAAVQSLEQWAPTNPEVLTALTEALADSDPGVRTQARWALSK